MHRGYLPIWRKFFEDHPFWTEKRKFSRAEAWIDILLNAHYKDEPKQRMINGKPTIIEYGECIMSTRYCGHRWGWTQSSVFRFIKLLESLEQIRLKSNQQPNHIIVCNYDKYDPKRITHESYANQPRISRESAANQTKELETVNKGKKGNNTPLPPIKISSKKSCSIDPDFKLTDEMRSWFQQQNFRNIEIERATADFIDYWLGVGKPMKDWSATWRNGMRKAEQWAYSKPRKHTPESRMEYNMASAEEAKRILFGDKK